MIFFFEFFLENCANTHVYFLALTYDITEVILTANIGLFYRKQGNSGIKIC